MTDFTVVAVRYCSDVPTMARFLETLGPSTRISNDDGTVAEMVAGHALVMLRPAAEGRSHVGPGGTELSIEVSDLDQTIAFLRRQRLDPLEWDGPDGRHAAIRDPRGDGIRITERMRDSDGYRQHDPRPNDMNLIAIRFSERFTADTAFYAQLGFAPRPGASPHWTFLELLGSGAGVIGLHPPNGELAHGPYSPDNPAAPPALVDLGFETHEPLPDLRARLTGAGVDGETVGGPAPYVEVTDPEGIRIQIHIAP